MQQLGLFAKEDVKPVELRTTIRLGRRSAQVSLAKRRREATFRLKGVLTSLEGKDILVSYCGGSHSHWWLNDLRLNRLKVDWGVFGSGLSGVVVLWGVRRGWRQQSVRLFLDQLVNVRSQDGYWLIDFWNGFGEYPIDPYKPTGYESIEIKLANKG